VCSVNLIREGKLKLLELQEPSQWSVDDLVDAARQLRELRCGRTRRICVATVMPDLTAHDFSSFFKIVLGAVWSAGLQELDICVDRKPAGESRLSRANGGKCLYGTTMYSLGITGPK
jgi:hypothetical protein